MRTRWQPKQYPYVKARSRGRGGGGRIYGVHCAVSDTSSCYCLLCYHDAITWMPPPLLLLLSAYTKRTALSYNMPYTLMITVCHWSHNCCANEVGVVTIYIISDGNASAVVHQATRKQVHSCWQHQMGGFANTALTFLNIKLIKHNYYQYFPTNLIFP